MDAMEMQEYRSRWRAVVAIEREEQQIASVDFRWRQLNSLLNMAVGLGLLGGAKPSEVERIRQRWNLLKELHIGHQIG